MEAGTTGMSTQAERSVAQRRMRQGLRLWRLGLQDRAAECFATAAQLVPENAQYRVQQGELARWRQHCQRLIGGDVVSDPTLSAKSMYLSVLGVQHAAWLYEAQRQADLAASAGVPRLHCLADAQRYIHEAGMRPDELLAIAVFCRTSGFVGSIRLCLAGRAALMTYWITPRQQGHGFGTGALELTRTLASLRGIQHIFAVTQPANFQSRAALAKAGFNTIATVLAMDRTLELWCAGPREDIGRQVCDTASAVFRRFFQGKTSGEP
ncbi:Acetyltransferase (GNAT) domain-containing protein [Pseudomonas sp. NFACC39-1]|nr:Acetyltransferase (GNAT) domain-containing protein [Pseudomonas sp. NFACC39-1]